MIIVFYGTKPQVGSASNCRMISYLFEQNGLEVSLSSNVQEINEQKEKSILFVEANGLDKEQKEYLFDQADLICITTNQQGEGLEEFFTSYIHRQQKMLLLIGKFIPEHSINIKENTKKWLRRYGIDHALIAKIPYSHYLNYALTIKSVQGYLRKNPMKELTFCLNKIMEGEKKWKKFSNNMEEQLLLF